MQELNKRTFVASASAIESNDLYMTIKTVMFTTPSANLNGVRCSLAFMSEIVENQAKYIGLPLCIDTKMVAERRLDKLGHCYDPESDTFYSTMIGSFYQFEMTQMDNGETALVGYARVLKRNKSVCKALSELFLENKLKFSFEISCGSCIPQEDGTILIDRADNNHIEGMAVVSMPACPDAVAMELIAELQNVAESNDNEEKETEAMEEVLIAEQVEVADATPVVAEEEVVEEVIAEEVVAEETIAEAVEEVAAVEAEEQEEVVAAQEEKEEKECGEEVIEAAEEPMDEEEKEDPEVPEEDPEEEDASCKEKKCAEEEIEALKAIVEKLVAEIELLKTPVVAEVVEEPEVVVAEVEEEISDNPFVETASISSNEKYSLLKEATRVTKYTLV